jgi:hypothetical protein
VIVTLLTVLVCPGIVEGMFENIIACESPVVGSIKTGLSSTYMDLNQGPTLGGIHRHRVHV